MLPNILGKSINYFVTELHESPIGVNSKTTPCFESNPMIQSETLSLAIAILVSFAANGFSQVKPVYVHSANVQLSQGSYIVHHMFVAGTVIEMAERNGRIIHTGSGKYKLDGNRFTIDWDNGGRERATYKRTKTGIRYRITSHTDNEQVGMVLNYQSKKLDQETSRLIRSLGKKIAANRVNRTLGEMADKANQFSSSVASPKRHISNSEIEARLKELKRRERTLDLINQIYDSKEKSINSIFGN